MRPLIAILANPWRSEIGDISPHDIINRAYTNAIHAAGGLPYVVPYLPDDTALEELLAPANGLLITGGDDVSPDLFAQPPHPHLGSVDPCRDALDRCAVAHVMQRPDLPVLGICRGLQALMVFTGGTLIQDIPSQVEGAIQHRQRAPGYHGMHEINITEGSLLAEIVGDTRLMTNSFHHQAVAEVPQGFNAIAWTCDGVIEAIAGTDTPFRLGVQFHPELMAGHHPQIAAIFRHFIAAANR